MALAAFAALAQIGISAYSGYEQEQQQQQAQSAAQNQEAGMRDSEQAVSQQNALSNSYDEQWMQLKQMSRAIYGLNEQPPSALTGGTGMPPK